MANAEEEAPLSAGGVRVTLYTTGGCPACADATVALGELGLSASAAVVRLDHCTPEFAGRVAHWVDGRCSGAVPLVFIGGVCVGGAADLRQLTRTELRRLFEGQLASDCPPPPPLPGPGDIDVAASGSDRSSGGLPCETDEAASTLEEIRRDAGAFGVHWRHFWRYPSTFTGAGLVRWAAERRGWGAEQARQFGDLLLSRRLCRCVYGSSDDFGGFQDNADSLYRPLADEWLGRALNADAADSQCRPLDSLAGVSERLRCLMLDICAQFVSNDGRQVDYCALSASNQFADYLALARRLQRVRPEVESRDERVAFFINVYNALVLHAKLAWGPPIGPWQRYRFFNSARYVIGGWAYSLQDIENGILRANRRGVGALLRPFGHSDPRLRAALERPEPLVHFALNCGARGCPPIRAYRPDGLDRQLRLACRAFLEGDDAVRVDPDGRLALSALFRWYAGDFSINEVGCRGVGGGNSESGNESDGEVGVGIGVAGWVISHMAPGAKREAAAAVVRAAGGQPRIRYLPYDWGHNSV